MSKSIIIKELRLLNFKGVRELTVRFGERQTTISGRNGCGKTTVFDAFTWLLFGKDSLDRKSFNIKTKDTSGKDIEKLPHEVSAILQVNGEEIALCRRLNEKWTKRKGSAVEEFTGNTEERLYNDVPCSVKEWQEKIAAICPEDVFKFITNPLYFSSQKADVQRTMLFRMIGGVSDEEIAKDNAAFQSLLSYLTGKTMDEFKREITAKKRRLKEEIEAIPERIDERKRDIPETEDWGALEKELADKEAKISEIDAQIADASKAQAAANDAKVKATRRMGELEQERTKIEMRITQDVQSAYYNQVRLKRQLEADIKDLQGRHVNGEKRKAACEKEIAECKARRAKFIADWQEINARTLEFKDGDFVCPICKRPLEVEDIEAKQREMTALFNSRKSQDLADNVQIGKNNTGRMKELEAELTKIKADIETYAAELAKKQVEVANYGELELPDAMHTVTRDGEWLRLGEEIEELARQSVKATIAAPDDTEIKDCKRVLQEAVYELKNRLSKREIIERNNKRIAELEQQHRTQSELLAELEGMEFTIAEFNKAKIEAVEQRINAMFKLVRFKMYEQQINGGEVETCEATVDGVPYADLNNAGRINAGIDIINAICKSEGIDAPIFIDNAEAINALQPTPSQVIRLVVTEDERLVINSDKIQLDLFNN